MAIWSLFSKFSDKEELKTKLHQKVIALFPGHDEKELEVLASLSGIMATIAYQDFQVHEGEKETIVKSLKKWCHFKEQDVVAVAELCIEHAKELAGIENHKYTEVLADNLPESERYGILESLFQVAAADGTASDAESEIIRNICHGLKLENKHFVSARATVLEFLGALK